MLFQAVRKRGRPAAGQGDGDTRRRAIGLFGLCLGTALIVMEANVVNVAIPVIRARLHADAAVGLWVVDAYTLVFAVLLLSAGRVGDRIGARRSYLVGLAVFGTASVLCSLVGQAALLIPARALQGAGAALLAPAPLTLITRMYTDPAGRARAVAVWVTVGGVGFTIGPLLGGLLLDTLGWRSIFLLNVPVVLLTGWLVRQYADEVPGRPVSFDFQDTRHYSAARTGLAFLPLTLTAIAATSFIGGRFVARRGARSGVFVGMMLSAAGLAILAAGAERVPYLLIAAGFVVFSLGMGLTAPAQTLAVMTFTPDEHKNMASSALNSARQTGGAAGVALLGALSAAHPATGLPVAMLLAVAACLITAINALRHIPVSSPLTSTARRSST